MANKGNIKLSFSAIDPFIVDNINKPTEKEVKGQGFISWGDSNDYPNYLFDLYQNVATLHSVINGTTDYVVGDGVKSNVPQLSDADAEKITRDIAFDLLMYGGTAINVLRNKLGGVAKVYTMDFRNIRSSKKGDWLYYSEDFGRKSFGRGKYISYPQFSIEDKSIANSILYHKNIKYQTYPSPIYGAATIACELEKKINEYHLNSINNNFVGSVLVNLNNGVPSEEQQEEIERNFTEKFCGTENSGRVVISYNDNKDNSATIEKINTEDYSERYKTLQTRSRQEIFTAFRANPNLFGIPTENLGFSSEEYEGAFKLFNRCTVMPIQKQIVDILDKIFGVEGSIEIKPFSINFENNSQDVKTVE